MIRYVSQGEKRLGWRNITNQRDYVQNLLVAPLGYITGIRNEPATYGVTASFKF